MNTAIRALIWEQVWRNRIVFPALALLLALGGSLAFAQAHAAADLWWVKSARQTVIFTFLASLLIGFAPFTLMESHSGWRMNSMVTRWFVLPVRTSVLVLVPFIFACAFMALLMGVWAPVLKQLGPGFDATYFLVVLVLGVATTQALAWMLSRKPSQFWPIVSVLMPVILLLGIVPQDGARWAAARMKMIQVVVACLPVIAFVALYAARRGRCGDWSGGLPLPGLGQWLARLRPRIRGVRSSAGALFWSDTAKVAGGFFLSWMAFAVVVVGLQCLAFHLSRPDVVFSRRLIFEVCMHFLPALAVIWLAAGGLFIGSEPGTGFHTRLSPYRATLPVSVGTLAAQRVVAALVVWLLVWLPLLAQLPWADAGFGGENRAAATRGFAITTALLMTVSAHVLIGALPLFLWGRFEGFPNMLLASMITWAMPWMMAQSLQPDEGGHLRWDLAVGWLVLKVAVAAWAFTRAWRAGYTTWRYPAGVLVGWLVVASLLIWALPTWESGGAWRALWTTIFLPLGRLALCPLALAANRHR